MKIKTCGFKEEKNIFEEKASILLKLLSVQRKTD